jgi:hypothetical protein
VEFGDVTGLNVRFAENTHCQASIGHQETHIQVIGCLGFRQIRNARRGHGTRLRDTTARGKAGCPAIGGNNDVYCTNPLKLPKSCGALALIIKELL